MSQTVVFPVVLEHSTFRRAAVPIGLAAIALVFLSAYPRLVPSRGVLVLSVFCTAFAYFIGWGCMFYASPQRAELLSDGTLFLTFFGGFTKRRQCANLRRASGWVLSERVFEMTEWIDDSDGARVRLWTHMEGYATFLEALGQVRAKPYSSHVGLDERRL